MKLVANNLDQYKSWIQSFPVGQKIYRNGVMHQVMSAGIDFLILNRDGDGAKVRVSRNTVESLEFTPSPSAR